MLLHREGSFSAFLAPLNALDVKYPHFSELSTQYSVEDAPLFHCTDVEKLQGFQCIDLERLHALLGFQRSWAFSA